MARRSGPLQRVARGARYFALAALPFILLVRGSVMAHTFLGASGWLALILGGLLACGCVAILGGWIWRRLTGRDRRRQITRYVALPIVMAFCVYSVGWLSHRNAKSTSVAERWSELHPSLRLAVGTARLADSDFVITEIARTAADYDRMGLPRVDRSLHFVQSDGWIHAIDLRTRGRSEIRNGLSWLYFEVMGFDTLRHVGTADHLHVSLPKP